MRHKMKTHKHINNEKYRIIDSFLVSFFLSCLSLDLFASMPIVAGIIVYDSLCAY